MRPPYFWRLVAKDPVEISLSPTDTQGTDNTHAREETRSQMRIGSSPIGPPPVYVGS